MAVPLNRKRRIFRSNSLLQARPATRVTALAVAMPGAVAACAVAAWLLVRPRHLPAPAPASTEISAMGVDVVDGDTLRLGGTVVRLSGIAAPARGTACGGQDCGVASANALAALVRGRRVACHIVGHDATGRPSGVCLAGGVQPGDVQLNETQVRAGWARAKAPSVQPQEAEARAAARGLWRQVP